MEKIAAYLPKESFQHWAAGCPKCKYGIVSSPPLTGAADLHMERLVQALDKQIVFCDCQAGTRYRVYLLNRNRILIEEARRSPLMQASAAKLTHPDIEVARVNIASGYAMAPAPTVHLEPEAA